MCGNNEHADNREAESELNSIKLSLGHTAGGCIALPPRASRSTHHPISAAVERDESASAGSHGADPNGSRRIGA